MHRFLRWLKGLLYVSVSCISLSLSLAASVRPVLRVTDDWLLWVLTRQRRYRDNTHKSRMMPTEQVIFRLPHQPTCMEYSFRHESVLKGGSGLCLSTLSRFLLPLQNYFNLLSAVTLLPADITFFCNSDAWYLYSRTYRQLNIMKTCSGHHKIKKLHFA